MTPKKIKSVRAWTVVFPDGTLVLRTMRGVKDMAEAAARGEHPCAEVASANWEAVEVEIRPVAPKRKKRSKSNR